MLRVHCLVPPAEAPRGKFVLLRRGADLHFVTAPLSTHPYHANIVFTFIQEQNRGRAALSGGTHCSILSPGWKILGGGHYAVDADSREIRLGEKSTAYGKYPVDLLGENSGDLAEALGLAGFRLRLL